MLVITVLETKNKDGSDYIYLKAILNNFYELRGTGIAIKPVFMNGKGNYKIVQKNIKKLCNEYQGIHKVIYFFDVDSTSINYDQKQLNEEIVEYCNQNSYEIIWFKKTIEHVLINEVITRNKTKIAEDFYKKNKIIQINFKDLKCKNYNELKEKQSNVLDVLDKYLIKKK